jgi:methylenetetrahydrofolate--tRNA-(uracil-5-)-methyltransferase
VLDSLVLKAAEAARVPAGGALAVDRAQFSDNIEQILKGYDKLNIIREECAYIADNTIIATGPLTSDKMEESIAKLAGAGYLHFYDAVAPIVTAESIDMNHAFYSSRYNKGDADYLNCPMNEKEYTEFVKELVGAGTVVLKSFEKGDVFEGCMPIEVMAKRGRDSLRFGPMRPVGLRGPDGERYYAVVQLRKEDKYDRMYNLVGFQTNLTFSEQKRVFSMIPALRKAEFVRYGVMHRNTYLASPGFLTDCLHMIKRPAVFFAGQLTGVEGYMESAMTGLLAGMHLSRRLQGKTLIPPPLTTMCGSLCGYLAHATGDFAPMHVNFELVPPLPEPVKDKTKRKEAYADRALHDIRQYAQVIND